jgi:hypothetical protein
MQDDVCCVCKRLLILSLTCLLVRASHHSTWNELKRSCVSLFPLVFCN